MVGVYRLFHIKVGPARLSLCGVLVGMIVGISAGSLYGKPEFKNPTFFLISQSRLLTDADQENRFSPAYFYNYARIRDGEFSEIIREPWHDYSISPDLQEESARIMFKEPLFENSGYDVSSPVNLPFSGVTGITEVDADQSKSFPGIRKPESDVYTALRARFVFYGQQINLTYDKLLIISVVSSVSEDSVSLFWNSFSRANSNHLVDQMMNYRDLLGLGDWGYFQLVKATAAFLFPDNRLSTDLLTWALMIRSGYDVRLAFNQNSTTLLFPSDNSIYSRQFVEIGQKRFYLDRPLRSQLLVTCPTPFPGNQGIINLTFNKSLNFRGKQINRLFSIRSNNRKYDFALNLNPDAIRFYNDYPRTDPAVYYGAPVSSQVKEDLLRQLYPVFAQMNHIEAASILQEFVRKEFEFIPATKKGEEISCRFAEELLASKSGDDRSKAVLYSWLIRNLLRLPVIGLHFPGYYSTAILFNEQVDGDAYLWNKGRYLIADPTFKNIPIGVLMPELAGLIPQLIILPNGLSKPDNRAEIWNLAYKLGARRGGAIQDVIFDRQNRALIAGYFTNNKSNNPFVACFSEGKTLQWIRRFEGEGSAEAFAITKVNEDEIYIAGSFSGKLEMDGHRLESNRERRGLFLSQFNQNGELVWIKPVPIDSTMPDLALTYTIQTDRTGDNISIQWSNEDLRNLFAGFNGVNEKGLTLTGAGNFAPPTHHPFKSGSRQDISSGIVREYNRLKGSQSHSNVSGIIAVMNYLQKPGIEVSGDQIKDFISSLNPQFAINFPELSTTIGRIGLLKNESGIIILKTIDYKSLIFNNIRIENGARFIVSDLSNGDLSIAAVSGFQNIGNPLILTLNNLLIDRSSGNLILDYDHDHTLKTVFPKP